MLGCATSPANIQRKFVAENLQPIALQANPSAPLASDAPRLNMRVRVRVSSAYRHENREWESRVRRIMAGASAFAKAQFGVGLDVVQLAKWNRDESLSEPLTDSLSALEALDPGEDCDLVVGFVGADAYSTDYHAVGQARAPGRHMVLRGTESLAYRDAQARSLNYLPQDERDRVYEAIKSHTEVLVLVHEWAHTLGAPHDTELNLVMSQAYSPRAHMMSPATIEVVRRGLAARLAETPQARKLAELEQKKVIDHHREQLEHESRAAVEKTLDGSAKPAAPAAQRSPELSRNDRWELNMASELYNQRKYPEAAVRLQPLTVRYPAHPQVQLLHCQVEAGARPGEGTTAAVCRRACELDAGHTACAMTVQALRIAQRKSELPPAVEVLRLRAKGLRDPADLELVAQVLLGAGWLTAAEELLAGMGIVPSAMQLRGQIDLRRRWSGLPAGELPPERESDYLDVLARTTAKNRHQDANLPNDSKAFRQVPGLMVVAAEQLAVQGKLAQARDHCGKALSKYAKCLTGLYLMARIELAEKHWPAAQVQLRAVLSGDPSYEPAWRDLAKALAGAGQPAQVQELRGKFRAQFGRELEEP